MNSNQTNSKPQYRRYWPVPPLIERVYEYQDINKDVNLRNMVVKHFKEKILEWINTEPDFSKLKSKKKYIESVDGMMDIYQLLRHFIKKSGINWYDLRDNTKVVKHYLSKKL
jgi:hypothetical protein